MSEDDVTSDYGETLLMDECRKDPPNLDHVKFLIESKVDINERSKNDDRYTAIMVAETTEVMKLLHENGAEIDSQCPAGRTALMLCADSGRFDLCECLLKLGADANIRIDSGETALYHAKYGLGSKDVESIDRLSREYGCQM